MPEKEMVTLVFENEMGKSIEFGEKKYDSNFKSAFEWSVINNSIEVHGQYSNR